MSHSKALMVRLSRCTIQVAARYRHRESPSLRPNPAGLLPAVTARTPWPWWGPARLLDDHLGLKAAIAKVDRLPLATLHRARHPHMHATARRDSATGLPRQLREVFNAEDLTTPASASASGSAPRRGRCPRWPELPGGADETCRLLKTNRFPAAHWSSWRLHQQHSTRQQGFARRSDVRWHLSQRRPR